VTRKPEEKVARPEQEEFLSRWSRKKVEARQEPPQPAAEGKADPNGTAPELPPIDQLTFESDYRDFLHPKVSEDTRRAALKKLFSDPHFSAIDMMDVYIDDYSKTEPISAEMMAGLRQAQNILAWAKEDSEKTAREEALKEQQEQALEPPAAASPQPDAADPATSPLETPGTSVKS